MQTKTLLAALAAATLALTACGKNETAGASTAAAPADQSVVKAREDLMTDWRRANQTLKGMIENPSTFDAATFKENADKIANSTEQMWTYFEGEAAKGGEAADAIWTDAAGFKAETEKFTAAASALSAAAATASSAADVEKLYGEMASSCGSCHKGFRNN